MLEAVPDEPSHRNNAVWKRKRVRCYKYVDDGITTEKINFENADEGVVMEPAVGDDGEPMEVPVAHRLKHAIPSQNAFRMTSAAATSKVMKVNTLKTNLLCVGLSLIHI